MGGKGRGGGGDDEFPNHLPPAVETSRNLWPEFQDAILNMKLVQTNIFGTFEVEKNGRRKCVLVPKNELIGKMS